LKIPAGAVVVLQMHYTANGTAAADRTRIGIKYASAPPKTEVRVVALANQNFVLPAGAPDTRVDAEVTLNQDITLWSVLPHTHVRGKKWEVTAIYPDGRSELILNVPKYDFNWQTDYVFKQPLRLPKGTKLHIPRGKQPPAHKGNPDPKRMSTGRPDGRDAVHRVHLQLCGRRAKTTAVSIEPGWRFDLGAIGELNRKRLEDWRVLRLDRVGAGAERLLLRAALIGDERLAAENVPAVASRPAERKRPAQLDSCRGAILDLSFKRQEHSCVLPFDRVTPSLQCLFLRAALVGDELVAAKDVPAVATGPVEVDHATQRDLRCGSGLDGDLKGQELRRVHRFDRVVAGFQCL
jgi:hypothetical protein